MNSSEIQRVMWLAFLCMLAWRPKSISGRSWNDYVAIIARPAISEKHLLLTSQGKVRYELKNPYRDSTTHIIFEPLDFTAKLAALVPKPRVNLTRFHGVFAPNSKHRVQVTPAGERREVRLNYRMNCKIKVTSSERHP